MELAIVAKTRDAADLETRIALVTIRPCDCADMVTAPACGRCTDLALLEAALKAAR